MSEKKNIFLWSGGPDSTYSLITLLRDTEIPVKAMYYGTPIINPKIQTFIDDPFDTYCPFKGINYAIQQNRFIRNEQNAVETLKPLIEQQYRHFELEYIITYFKESINPTTKKADACLMYVYHYPYPSVLFSCLEDCSVVEYHGRCKEDFDTDSYMTRDFSTWASSLPLINYDHNVQEVHINKDVNKQTIKQQLGTLWPLTVSCGFPDLNFKPCGQCQKCRHRGELI